MGAKPSKQSDEYSQTLQTNPLLRKKKHNFRAALNRKKKVNVPSSPLSHTSVIPTAPTITINSHATPPSCTTNKYEESTHLNNEKKPLSNQSSISTASRQSNHASPYDSARSKKSKRSRLLSAASNNNTALKHLSIISNNTIASSDYVGFYSDKSNISSTAWTVLSNDPFSQIEASASAFTEITDHSTISRKSLYNVAGPSTSPPSYYNTKFNNTSSIIQNNAGPAPVLTQDILSQLKQHPSQSYRIIQESYQHAQQQNDPFDWTQFYHAIHQYSKIADASNKSIAIVYLAKCLIFGFGVNQDIERGFNLLHSHPSCETNYALGRCYLDGVPSPDNKRIDSIAAFEYFKVASEYTPTNDSILNTVAEAQCILARMLFQGEGVTQNTEEALKYLMMSASNDNMYAQFLVGVHYERGIDVTQDLEKARHYYGKSAEGGFPDAQAALGSRLVAEQNYTEGIEWLEKAIQMGNSRAHVQLGILYDKGEGVEQCNDMALLHYKAAVESNNYAAQYILGLVYYFGRLGRQKNHKEAIRLIKQSAMAGLPYAQRVLGQLYQQGSIVSSQDAGSNVDSRLRTKRNEREAIRWYKRAATGKDVAAMAILGKCHEQGVGVEMDLEKALAFYTKAAEVDSPYVYNILIDQAILLQKMARHTEAFDLYSRVLSAEHFEKHRQPIQTARLSVARYHLCRDIEGVPYDPLLAHTMLLDLIEETGDSQAHYWLGSIYDEGIPGLFEIDRQKAFHHFTIAAEGGDNDATFLVAYMMSNHIIPDKGPADAFPWYQKAAVNGHPMSMHSLGLCFYKGIGQLDDKPELDTALEWFEKAARYGVVQSVPYMARIYLQLMISHVNDPQQNQQFLSKAIQCLKRATENNDTYAQRELGKIYLTGHGLPVDHVVAVELLGKAASKNDAEAITFLGDCYHKGTGIEKDLEKAIECYLHAAELGYPFAYSAAAELYYEVGDMEHAYDYYLFASKQTKIVHNNIGKTARMMVARLSLGYIPPAQANPLLLQALLASKKTISEQSAFGMLLTLATQDCFPQAYQPLGCCFLHGKGTSIDPEQAVSWFKKSAEELNDSIAYFNLADIFGSGLVSGISVDITLALAYLRKSADLGYTEAQFRMGIVYLQGEYGVRVDERAAANFFKLSASKSHAESVWMLSQMSSMIGEHELELQYQKQAASLGHVLSMRVLGQRFLKQLDASFLNNAMQHEYLDEALKYLHMAGESGDIQSLILLGKTYNNCLNTKIKFSTSHHFPTPDDSDDEGESRFQSEEDEKNLAIECFEKASNLGSIDATVYAAEAWYEQKQFAAALEYFKKAANQGSVLARFFCARYYIEGYGGSPLDPEKGFQELLICANELSCIHAYNAIGQCYENGIGTSKDDQLAFEWYIRAAETTHDAEAYYRIAVMYAQQRISTHNHHHLEACKYFNLAINITPNNHGESCYQLGLYYLHGIQEGDAYVLLPDTCLAIEYLHTAADLGIREAMYQLGTLFLNDDYSVEEQEEAVSLLQRAADLGLREAQFELGLLYHQGKEIYLSKNNQHYNDSRGQAKEEEGYNLLPQDFERAYDLFCRSASQKHPTATYYLGVYHQHGIFVAPDLTIALEQYESAIDLFNLYEIIPNRWQAEFNLASILHQDLQSRARAYELFQAANFHAPLESQFLPQIMIARYHLYGWANVAIQTKDAVAALIRFAQDEKIGCRVYLDLAQCFEHGIGVEKDLVQAFHWYGEIISRSHAIEQQQDPMLFDEEFEEQEATAMFKLAEFYRKGMIVQKDTSKADNLYRLAAQKGSSAAQEYLSILLQETTLSD
ncbi:hypothetical protein EDC96DRAFT_497811 [Choanephora cucurbitarum]|nr:hypothetical protein EDC96DRAFT_497811 [Choanephora cucurbitarum]